MSTRYQQLLNMIEACGVAPGLGSVGRGWQMEQNPRELAKFLVECEEIGVTSILELGTGEFGGMARFLTEYLLWEVTSIDHRIPLHESGRFILGETGDADVYAQVKDERFDLVLIDADHHDYSVRRDHEWYAPLATKLVALHDIAPNREGTQGVAVFWWNLSRSKDIPELAATGDLKPGYEDIIDPQHPIGIGYYEVQHE